MGLMIAAEAMPATVQDVGGEKHEAVLGSREAVRGNAGTVVGNHEAVLGEGPPQTDGRLISRLPLAFVLAAISVLIPGEGGRFLDALVYWSDLLPARRRSLKRMSALTTAGQPRATSNASGLV